jgi:hypothetical protein
MVMSDNGAAEAIGSEIRTLETTVSSIQKQMGGEFKNRMKTGEGKSGISAWWERVILWSPSRIREIEAAVRELQEKQKELDGEEIKNPVKGSGIVLDPKGRLSALRLSVEELDDKVDAMKIKAGLAEKAKEKKAEPNVAALEEAKSQAAPVASMVQAAPATAVNALPNNNAGQRTV